MDKELNIKRASISGMIYRFMERILAQLVSTIVAIVLARILIPEDYGVISLITIFITVCNVIVTNGLGSALVQKKEPDEVDYSTVFWASILLSVLLYMGLFLGAPLIASYFDNGLLCPILRVIGLRIPLAAINSVQSAYVSKRLLFRKFFWATLIGTITSGVVGIVLALRGFGPWALAAQMLINPLMDTFFLFLSVKWYPRLLFSKDRFVDLFSYGWKILFGSLLDTTYEEVRGVIIAKRYSASDLSFYSKGKRFPSLIGTNVASTVSSVLFPVFSLKQDNIPVLKGMVRRSMCLECYLLCPVMIGLASIANSFVRLLLTDKWLQCVPYMYIFCIFYLFKPLKNISQCSIIALKRSDLDLLTTIIEKATGIIFIIATYRKGPIYLALSALLTYIVAAFFNLSINRKLIGYSYKEQFVDIVPSLFLSIVACTPSFFLNYSSLPIGVMMFLQIISSIVLYVGLSFVLKLRAFYYSIHTIKEYVNKKHREESSDTIQGSKQ